MLCEHPRKQRWLGEANFVLHLPGAVGPQCEGSHDVNHIAATLKHWSWTSCYQYTLSLVDSLMQEAGHDPDDSPSIFRWRFIQSGLLRLPQSSQSGIYLGPSFPNMR